jgi:predicted Zn finger-like uncharacterized protein
MTSLVTRCPACGTLFKVVPDQLRISEGWVRCGQCDEVFDAQAQMQAPMELVPDADAATEPPPTESATESLSVADATSAVDVQAPQPLQTAPNAPEAAPPVPDEAVQAVTDTGTNMDTGAVVQEMAPDSNAGIPRFTQSAADAESFVDAPPSFLNAVAPPARAARWRQWLFATALCLLGIGLLVQVGLQQRARIVATEPALAPVFEALCQWAGCAMGPLRQIESVVIESSSFIKVKTDVYRLSFSIKNTALVPVALPFAEVTLTDLRDQSVLRRVVSPVDYGARGESLAPGEELSLVVPVAVKAVAGISEKITGYRLLVFYP